MKRIVGIILIVVLVLGLSGCCIPKRLTLDKVVELSSQGYELTWSDFEQYYGYECGSGLYVMCYVIDNDYEVRVGGFSREDKLPMYVYLKRRNDTGEPPFIDIRKEDVKAFVNAT